MSISESKYRLGEFMIIEHGGVLLTWVTHVALGDQRSGKCSIIGDILVIGPSDHEEAGYLKLEFHEHLMKLPAWNKTRYYCFATNIREVGSEQGHTSNLIKRLSADNIYGKTVNIIGPGIFRLGRYEIIVDENSIISWRTIGQSNTTIGGKCFTESGLLFLGPKEYELDEGRSKQGFLSGLKLLPQWDRTSAWGHYGSLLNCKGPEPRKSREDVWKSGDVKSFITNNIPFPRRQQFRKEKILELKTSGFEWFKTTWHRASERKVWSRVTSIIIRGSFLGFRVLIFFVGMITCLSSKVIERIRGYYSNRKG